MPWRIILTVDGLSKPEIFDIDDQDSRLVTYFGAGQPQEWAANVADVEKQIWKQMYEIGAYSQIVNDNGVTIPLTRIVKMEISKI